MGFWDKIGGAAKWITDPKQLLTAAGFAVGGPVGAGIGRSVGGMVPQSLGPVPWGALGADTRDFREGTLEDGLQWGDVGQAGKDFASGYSVGNIAQQVPGVQNLEGAFAGGAEAGQGMGVEALTRNNPDFMNAPDFGSRMSSVGAPPGVGGAGGMPNFNPDLRRLSNATRASASGAGVQTPFDPMAPPHELVGLGGGAQTQAPFDPTASRSALGQPVPEYADLPAPAPDPLAGAFGGQQGMGTDAMMSNYGRNSPRWPTPASERGFSAQRTQAQTVLDKNRIVNEVQKGKEGENWWGGMSGIERMYAVNMASNLLATTLADDPQIGSGGINTLGQMGLFSQAPQRPIPSFEQWRSQRGRYA